MFTVLHAYECSSIKSDELEHITLTYGDIDTNQMKRKKQHHICQFSVFI